jgi:hypothetical protein
VSEGIFMNIISLFFSDHSRSKRISEVFQQTEKYRPLKMESFYVLLGLQESLAYKTIALTK